MAVTYRRHRGASTSRRIKELIINLPFDGMDMLRVFQICQHDLLEAAVLWARPPEQIAPAACP